MKKIIISIIAIIATLNINAQRVSTQRFMVRKITFNARDQIVPIKGVDVEINKAKFRSNDTGQFTANIPVSKDMGFYISNINAPGYIVSIPEDLSKKIYLSSNQCVIVLADINAVKAERNRIYNNNKAALAKQEERLKAEVKKNQELLNRIEKQELEYNSVLAELEKTKRQLESFNNAKTNLEVKIDSLSYSLSMVDYASLGHDEQIRLEKDKDGEWVDIIVDDVISKLEMNLNTNQDKVLSDFENKIDSISNDYYQKFIKGSHTIAADQFVNRYYDYLYYVVKEMIKEKSNVLDKLLLKVVEEDIYNLLEKNINDCIEKWRKNIKRVEDPWQDYTSHHWIAEYFGFFNKLKNVFSDSYLPCKKVAEMCLEKYKTIELVKLTDANLRHEIKREIEEEVRRKYFEINTGYNIVRDWGVNEFISLVAEEVLEPLRKRYNKFIDRNFKEDQ